MDLEAYLLEVIRGKRKALWLTPVLRALSVLYRSVLCLRNKAYDVGVFSSHSVGVPVVSIGNIVVGGTGKTPVTQMLTLALQTQLNVAILTRGFRSQMERRGEMGCISQGNGSLVSAAECGDEPYLLSQKTKATIWVGSSRVKSAQAAISQGAECLLLDDGMQHRKIARDFEIVVIDAQDPLSKGRFLPRGLLRDSPYRLRNASLIILTHCVELSHFETAKRQIARYTHASVVGVKVSIVNQKEFQAEKVGVFCGLGTPERFLQTVRDLKSEIVDTFLLKDHGTISEQELISFAQKCKEKGASKLICTEKDAVKLPQINLPIKIKPLEMQLEFVAGEEHFKTLVQKILSKVGK